MTHTAYYLRRSEEGDIWLFPGKEFGHGALVGEFRRLGWLHQRNIVNLSIVVGQTIAGVARMKQSAIRESRFGEHFPGLRFAPSGLRLPRLQIRAVTSVDIFRRPSASDVRGFYDGIWTGLGPGLRRDDGICHGVL